MKEDMTDPTTGEIEACDPSTLVIEPDDAERGYQLHTGATCYRKKELVGFPFPELVWKSYFEDVNFYVTDAAGETVSWNHMQVHISEGRSLRYPQSGRWMAQRQGPIERISHGTIGTNGRKVFCGWLECKGSHGTRVFHFHCGD